MSVVKQFNSTSLSLFNLLTDNKVNVTNKYIRDYIHICTSNDESELIEQFIINILPSYDKIKNKDLNYLNSNELNELFKNKIDIYRYINDENKEIIFSYLELLCNISIEYLKVSKLI